MIWQIAEGPKVQSELLFEFWPCASVFLGLLPCLENGALVYQPHSLVANVAEVMGEAH